MPRAIVYTPVSPVRALEPLPGQRQEAPRVERRETRDSASFSRAALARLERQQALNRQESTGGECAACAPG